MHPYGEYVYFHTNRFGGGFNGIDLYRGSLKLYCDTRDADNHTISNGDIALIKAIQEYKK